MTAYSHDRLDELESKGEIWFGRDNRSIPSRKTFLADLQSGVTPITIWTHEEAGHNHEANNELKAHGLAGLFQNPKPTRLIRKMLQLATSPGEEHIVLDFFAGSGTTGEAVLRANAADGGNRRFILIELPWPTSDDRLPTIADVAEERIRSTISDIERRSGVPEESLATYGFRALDLAPSTLVTFESSDGSEDSLQSLLNLHSSLAANAEEADVVWEMALDYGLGLQSHVVARDVAGARFLQVQDADLDRKLVISLESRLTDNQLLELAVQKDDVLICRDDALDDSTVANLTLQCRLRTL